MASSFKYLCSGCSKSESNKPGFTYCQVCHRDNKAFRSLDTLISRARPQHRDTPAPLLLARLWLQFAREHHCDDGTVVADAERLVHGLAVQAKRESFEQLTLRVQQPVEDEE